MIFGYLIGSQFVALLIREIVFLDATISAILGILCFFLVETQALNDNSSSSGIPNFFKCEHKAIGQSLQQCNSCLAKKKHYFLDQELIEPLW